MKGEFFVENKNELIKFLISFIYSYLSLSFGQFYDFAFKKKEKQESFQE